MGKKKKVHTAEFKAKVALAAIHNEETVAEQNKNIKVKLTTP